MRSMDKGQDFEEEHSAHAADNSAALAVAKRQMAKFVKVQEHPEGSSGVISMLC